MNIPELVIRILSLALLHSLHHRMQVKHHMPSLLVFEEQCLQGFVFQVVDQPADEPPKCEIDTKSQIQHHPASRTDIHPRHMGIDTYPVLFISNSLKIFFASGKPRWEVFFASSLQTSRCFSQFFCRTKERMPRSDKISRWCVTTKEILSYDIPNFCFFLCFFFFGMFIQGISETPQIQKGWGIQIKASKVLSYEIYGYKNAGYISWNPRSYHWRRILYLPMFVTWFPFPIP